MVNFALGSIFDSSVGVAVAVPSLFEIIFQSLALKFCFLLASRFSKAFPKSSFVGILSNGTGTKSQS
jgi:hypothetical protein